MMNEVGLVCSLKGSVVIEATCHHRHETLVTMDTNRCLAHLALMTSTVSL